jgi:hypothetical protein
MNLRWATLRFGESRSNVDKGRLLLASRVVFRVGKPPCAQAVVRLFLYCRKTIHPVLLGWWYILGSFAFELMAKSVHQDQRAAAAAVAMLLLQTRTRPDSKMDRAQ